MNQTKLEALVRRMLDLAYAGAKAILMEHRKELELVAETLRERETLDRAEFLSLIGRPVSEA